MKGRRLNNLVLGVWVANVLICVILAGGWLLFKGLPAARAEKDAPHASLVPPNWATFTPKPTITPVPPPTQRPTITPWPTPSPGPSLTPWVVRPANVREIGQSVEKRSILVHKFGDGPVVKLIVAGIHGGYEHNTVELAEELIAYIGDHPERIPVDTTLYILPDLNPDGYLRDKGVDGRTNANNVDLNRNWPYNWVIDWPRDGCWIYRPVTGGTSGGSEPEVQALIKFIDEIKPVALISYHSAALGIFPGGKPDFGPSIDLADAVAEVTDYPYPPIDTGCDYTGNLTDWAANTRSIPSIDIELTNHRDTDFDINLRVLQAFLDWRK